jgi:hypothetical protein
MESTYLIIEHIHERQFAKVVLPNLWTDYKNSLEIATRSTKFSEYDKRRNIFTDIEKELNREYPPIKTYAVISNKKHSFEEFKDKYPEYFI